MERKDRRPAAPSTARRFRVITGADNGAVHVWENARCIKSFRAHRPGCAVRVLSCSADGAALFSGGMDGRLHAWRADAQGDGGYARLTSHAFPKPHASQAGQGGPEQEKRGKENRRDSGDILAHQARLTLLNRVSRAKKVHMT